MTLDELRSLIASVDAPDLPEDHSERLRVLGIEVAGVRSASELVQELRMTLQHSLGSIKKGELARLKRQLVFEHVLYDCELRLLLSVIEILTTNAEAPGASQGAKEVHWRRAVVIALQINLLLHDDASDDESLALGRMNRECNVAMAAKRLVGRGYSLEPVGGAMAIERSEVEAIGEYLISEIRQVGGSNFARWMFGILAGLYDSEHERYVILKQVSQTTRPRSPAIPFGYLLNLAIREYASPGRQMEPSDRDAKCRAACALARDLVAVLDVEDYCSWAWLFARESRLVESLQRTVVYDTCFLLNQCAPWIALETIELVFSEFSNSECTGAWGASLGVVHEVASLVFNEIARTNGPIEFGIGDLASRSSASVAQVRSIIGHLAHPVNSANEKYLAPWDACEITFGAKPLMQTGADRFVLVDRSWCAPAFYEGLCSALRASRAKNVDVRLGEGVEILLRESLRRHGVMALHGDYVAGKKTLECDCLVVSKKEVILFEIKKKALTRSARAANSLRLLSDLAASLVSAHNQCLRHEIELLRGTRMVLRDNRGSLAEVELDGRRVQRIGVTLTNFGSIHDRMDSQRLLEAVSEIDFSVDGEEDSELERLRRAQRALRKGLGALGTLEPERRDPFYNCAFMSITELLTLLLDVNSDDDLQRALSKCRSFSTGSCDFLFEYKYGREMASS